MGLIDRIRTGEWRADASPPVAVAGRSPTLREVAERVRTGEDAVDAMRELLDRSQRMSSAEISSLVANEPPLVEPRFDALVAGVVEFVALRADIGPPAWADEPSRFLERCWFITETAGLRAISISQSPISLKRRGIFWPRRSLVRV